MRKLIIIGAGPGGYECAVRAAKAGLEVHLVDNASHIGGTCLNEGCIPTKCLCHTAEVLEIIKTAKIYGIPCDVKAFDLSAAIERKNEIVSKLQQGIVEMLRTANVIFHEGTAQFLSGNVHTVIVKGVKISADYILIATGSRPKFLPISGAHSKGVITSTDLLCLKELPKRICIIGGGVIGLEFAAIFNSFGTEVKVIEFCKEILPNFDRDIAKRLRLNLKKKGIEFITDAPVTAIHSDETKEGELHVSYEWRNSVHDAIADVVLMAVGRAANIDSLNLSDVGINYTPRGIVVDENMQTNIEGVYAVGDINGLCQLAHAATFQSYRALNHILGKTDRIRLDLIPSAVFTTPEAAMVGLTEEQAKAQGIEFAVHKSFYRSNGRAMAMDAGGDGLVKIITTHEGKILGAHILGSHASDLIHEITAIISLDGSLSDIRRTIHAHPTLSELILQAAE